jgi:hypothetical protein
MSSTEMQHGILSQALIGYVIAAPGLGNVASFLMVADHTAESAPLPAVGSQLTDGGVALPPPALTPER